MDRSRRRLQCVAHLDQVALRIEKLSTHVMRHNCWPPTIQPEVSDNHTLTIYRWPSHSPWNGNRLFKEGHRGTAARITDLKLQRITKKVQLCTPLAAYYHLKLGRGERSLSQGGIAAILKIQTPWPRVEFRSSQGQLGSTTSGKQAFWK